MDADAGRGERRHDRLVPAGVLLGDELLGPPGDPLQLRERLEPVGRRVLRQHVAERLLAQPGHADHEELVQVRREDRQKLHPLQQRIVRVLRPLPARAR